MPNVIVVRNTYPDAKALHNVINYALNKTAVKGGYAVDCEENAALKQMLFVKQAFHKTEALQLKHFFITFADKEATLIDFNDLLNLGFMTGQLFREYQMVFGVHLDGSHIHMHIVMNTTSFIDGHQYSDGISMFQRLCDMLRQRYTGYQVNLFLTPKYDKDASFSKENVGVYQLID